MHGDMLWIILLMLTGIVRAQEKIAAFYFRDDTKDVPIYLTLEKEPEDENTAVTVCMRIFPTKMDKDEKLDDYAISLANVRLETLDQLHDRFDPETNRFLEARFVRSGTRMINGDYKYQFKGTYYDFKNNAFMGEMFEKYPYKWYHVCFSFFTEDRKNGDQVVWLNGRKIFHGKNKTVVTDYRWAKGNKLRIGYSVSKMDVKGGQFFGLMADIQVFSRRVSDEDMREYTSCRRKLYGNLISWEERDKWIKTGEILEREVDYPEICEPEGWLGSKLMVFPVLVSALRGDNLCESFGGWTHVELDPDLILKRDIVMFNKIRPYSYINKPNPRCQKRLWIGMHDEDHEDEWRITKDNSVLANWTSYMLPGQPNGGIIQNFGSLNFQQSGLPGLGIKQWDDGADDDPSCVMCYLPLPPRARFRGIPCEQDILDKFYTLVWDDEYQIPYYKGYTRNIIRLIEKLDEKDAQKEWHIININNHSQVIGRTNMYPYGSSMATGIKIWHFNQEVCGKTELKLSLTVCNDDSYTCRESGKCIDMEKRCDKYPNCPEDFSDETNCTLVNINKNYVKHFAPIQENRDKIYLRTNVYISVDIINILSINEVEETFQVRFRLELMWNDFRLHYFNLKDNSDQNTLTDAERKNIWIPRVIFVNTRNGQVSNSDSGFLKVQRSEDPDVSTLNDIDTVQIYGGHKSTISLMTSYNEFFLCQYDMSMYPFDTQVCTMEFRADGNSAINVEIRMKELHYLGRKDLTQYFIRRTNISLGANETVIVEVTLGRRLVGTVLTVYIPTILMLFISQSTNFFKPFYFEAAVTVNLTTLLVLVTMFLSLSSSLPNTAYVKMIDVWLVFNLIVPFLFVLLHTLVDNLRTTPLKNHHGTMLQTYDEDDITTNDETESNTDTDSAVWTLGVLEKIPVVNSWLTEGLEIGLPNEITNKKDQLKKAARIIKNYRLRAVVLFSQYVVPILGMIFSSVYWYIGLIAYYEMSP